MRVETSALPLAGVKETDMTSGAGLPSVTTWMAFT